MVAGRGRHTRHTLNYQPTKGAPFKYSFTRTAGGLAPKQQSINRQQDQFSDPRANYVRAHYREIKKYFPLLHGTPTFDSTSQGMGPAEGWENNLDRNTKDFYLPPDIMNMLPVDLRPPNSGCYDNETNHDATPPTDDQENRDKEKDGYAHPSDPAGPEKEILRPSPTPSVPEKSKPKFQNPLKRPAQNVPEDEPETKRSTPWYIKAGRKVFEWFKHYGLKLLKWAVNLILDNYHLIHPLLKWIFQYFSIVFPGQAMVLQLIAALTSTFGALAIRLVYFTWGSVKWGDDESFWAYAARLFGSIFMNLACMVPNSVLQLLDQSKHYLMGSIQSINEWDRLLNNVARDLLIDILTMFCKYAVILKIFWGTIKWLAKKIYKQLKDWRNAATAWIVFGSICILVFSFVAYILGLLAGAIVVAWKILKALAGLFTFAKNWWTQNGGGEIITGPQCELLMEAIEEYDTEQGLTLIDSFSDLVPQDPGLIGWSGDVVQSIGQTSGNMFQTAPDSLWFGSPHAGGIGGGVPGLISG